MKFSSRAAILAAAAIFLALPAMTPAQAQTFSADQREEIGNIIKDYLLAHPEVMQDVMAELEKRQQAAEAEKHRTRGGRKQGDVVQLAASGCFGQSPGQSHDGRVLRL